MSEKVIVKQIRSGIGSNQRVKETLLSLGLGKIGKSANHTLNDCVKGMIRKVSHLVVVNKG